MRKYLRSYVTDIDVYARKVRGPFSLSLAVLFLAFLAAILLLSSPLFFSFLLLSVIPMVAETFDKTFLKAPSQLSKSRAPGKELLTASTLSGNYSKPVIET